MAQFCGKAPWDELSPSESETDESTYMFTEEEEEEEEEEEDEEIHQSGAGPTTAPKRRRRPIPPLPASTWQNPRGNTSVFLGGSRFAVNYRSSDNTLAGSEPDNDTVHTLQNLPVRAENLSNVMASSARALLIDRPEAVPRAEGDTPNIRPMSTEHPDPTGRIALREMFQDVVEATINPYSNEDMFTPSTANRLSRRSAAFHYRMGGRRSETLRARLERPRTPSPEEGDEQANRPYSPRTRRRREKYGASFVASPGKRRRLAIDSDGPKGRNSIQRPAKRHATTEERTASLSVRSAKDKTLTRGLDGRHQFGKSVPLAGYPPKRPKNEPKQTSSIVFLSQCLPRSFCQTKRVELLRVLTGNPKALTPFVPACITFNVLQGSRKPGLLGTAKYFKPFFAPGTGLKEWITPLDPGLLYIISSNSFTFFAKAGTVMPKHPSDVAPFLGPSDCSWPAGQLPLEIFSKIARYLPRDAILNMRLVNHEFERNMAHAAFGTVVVAFRPEIYGMMVLDSDPAKKSKSKGKGKALATQADCDDISHAPYTGYCGKVNSKAICDGMKVFESLGAQMKNFAMTFEVDEHALTHPPEKGRFETLSTFYGQYSWPIPYYSRYELCAGLEQLADDTRCMTKALSNLTNLIVLGLSVDSGLGWISGPDQSDRASIFKSKPAVFGSKYLCPDAQMRDMITTWQMLRANCKSTRGVDKNILRSLLQIVDRQAGDVTDLLNVLRNTTGARLNAAIRRPATNRWTDDSSDSDYSDMSSYAEESSDGESANPLIFRGIDIATVYSRSTGNQAAQNAVVNASINDLMQLQSTLNGIQGIFAKEPLIPRNPNPAQREWLLETEWAQRAFVSSYCLAIMDNASTFQNVRTFTVSRISSRFLGIIQRQDMWEALPNLESLTLVVSPDWRDVVKQHDGFVGLPALWPSGACQKVFNFLETCVAGAKNIKNLKIGWVGGGEHATGIYARNKHVLPAPIIDMEDSIHVVPSAHSMPANVLSLPYVENLTLVNCWFFPHTLKVFVSSMSHAKLKSLKLESVSLTADVSTESNHLEDTSSNISDTVSSTATTATGQYAWLTGKIRKGSWGDVIDTITPGDNLVYKRFEHGYGDEPVRSTPSGALRCIEFDSCGYTRLLALKNFDQSALQRVADMDGTNPLYKRAHDLAHVMMATDDPLLGQIVPSMEDAESGVLQTAFGMRMGWTGQKKHENREDGQPAGGSGRFSGVVGCKETDM